MRGHVEDKLMDTPTLSQIAAALRSELAALLVGQSGVQLVPETSSFNPDVANIVFLQAFRPSQTESAELSGRLGLGKRHGVYMVTISAPWGDSAKAAQARAWADAVCDAYRRQALDTDEGPVYTDEPNVFMGAVSFDPTVTGGGSSVSGKDPDQRYSISISVPWTAWTGGVE